MKKNMITRMALVLALVTISLKGHAQMNIEIRRVKDTDSIQFHDEKFPGGFDFSLSLSDKKHHGSSRGQGWSLFSGGFGVGFLKTQGAPNDMHVNMGQSIELNWSNALGIRYGFAYGNSLSIGMGFLWRNYRMTNQYRFLQATDGTLSIAPYPEGTNPTFSRLHTASITIPLKYRHQWRNGWRLAIGPELAFVPNGNKHNSTLKTRYQLDGKRYKDKVYDVHVQRAAVNMVANVAWKQIGVYARWSPNDVIDKNYGPQFGSLSMGFMVFGF